MLADYPPNCFRLTLDISDRLCAAGRLPPKPLLPLLADKLEADLRPYVR
jgi:hypothetical protein